MRCHVKGPARTVEQRFRLGEQHFTLNQAAEGFFLAGDFGHAAHHFPHPPVFILQCPSAPEQRHFRAIGLVGAEFDFKGLFFKVGGLGCPIHAFQIIGVNRLAEPFDGLVGRHVPSEYPVHSFRPRVRILIRQPFPTAIVEHQFGFQKQGFAFAQAAGGLVGGGYIFRHGHHLHRLAIRIGPEHTDPGFKHPQRTVFVAHAQHILTHPVGGQQVVAAFGSQNPVVHGGIGQQGQQVARHAFKVGCVVAQHGGQLPVGIHQPQRIGIMDVDDVGRQMHDFAEGLAPVPQRIMGFALH